MNVAVNKVFFFTSWSSFQLYSSSFKSLKNLHQFPQNPEYQNQYGYQNRAGQQCHKNAAAIAAINIPNKRNIKIYGSTYVSW